MIEIDTRYTLKSYREFYWFSLFRGKYYWYGQVFFLTITVLLLVISVLSLFSYLSPLTFIPVAMAAVCVIFCIVVYIKPRRYVEKSPALFGSNMKIVFEMDDFTTTRSGDMTNSTSVTKYEAVIKAYETKKAFYLFLTPEQAVIMVKEDFSRGTPEELRKLLRKKLQTRLVVCK